MMDENMRLTLARWGFRPIGNDGRLLTDGEDKQPTPQPKDNEETRKLAQKILTIPDVKI